MASLYSENICYINWLHGIDHANFIGIIYCKIQLPVAVRGTKGILQRGEPMQTVPKTIECDAWKTCFRIDLKLFRGNVDVRIRGRETVPFSGRER